jgi:hypothetical protein
MAVQTSVEVDYLKPVAAWKREPNSTLAKLAGKTVINDNYASPGHVPALMSAWLAEFDARRRDHSVSALDAYVRAHATFARIHPYADGNGRMARLLANLPVIAKGHLPILISRERRLDYIESLASWQFASGPPLPGQPLEGDASSLTTFKALCELSCQESSNILNEVLAAQHARRR